MRTHVATEAANRSKTTLLFWRLSGRQRLPSFSQPDRPQIDHSGDRTGEPLSERASAGSATTFSISSKRR